MVAGNEEIKKEVDRALTLACPDLAAGIIAIIDQLEQSAYELGRIAAIHDAMNMLQSSPANTTVGAG